MRKDYAGKDKGENEGKRRERKCGEGKETEGKMIRSVWSKDEVKREEDSEEKCEKRRRGETKGRVKMKREMGSTDEGKIEDGRR